MLKSCDVHEKPAVNAQFVHDCAEQNRLLDEESYGFGALKGKKKRGRPSIKGIYSTQKKVVNNEKKIPTKTPTKPPKPQKPVSKPAAKVPDDGFDDPIPCPVVRDVAGRYAFTTEEREYFSRYTTHLLNVDPTMSNTSISKRMYAKVLLVISFRSRVR